MAETTKIVVEVEATGTGKVTQSLADLKKELKAAQSAALNGDGVAAKRVAELRDKMDDLKDSVKTLQGSGVEKAQSSFRLLFEGFKNFDTDKIKTGFSGIGSALKAIPIFLIAEGISYLIENWKELSEGTGVLAKVLQGVTWVFTKLKEEIYALTDAIGLTNTALEKQGEAIKSNAEKATEALQAQNAEYDRQIRVAKASGESTVEIEKKKQQAIIDTNLLIAKQEQAFIGAAIRSGEAVDKQHYERLNGALEAIRNAKVSEFEINKGEEKKSKDEYLKNLDAKKKADEDARKEKYKKDQEFLMQNLKDEEYLKAQDELDKKKAMEDADALAQYEADKLNYSAQIQEDVSATEKKNDEEAKEAKKKAVDDAFEYTKQGLVATQALSDTVFAFRMSQVKKGSAEELKVRKQQFQVEKAFKVAQIVMDGIQGAMKAYAMNPLPSPIGVISASLQGVAAAAAAVKVASTKFDAGSSGASADTGGGGLSVGGSIGGASPAPTTNAPTVQPFTKLDESGRNQSMPVVKAYVVESEMTDSQNRVSRLSEQASFG